MSNTNQPVVLAVLITFKRSPRSATETLVNTIKTIDRIMTNTNAAQVEIKTAMRYPEVLGAYSSMEVSLSLRMPIDPAIVGTPAFTTTVDGYQDITSEYVMQSLNKACVLLGKPEPFSR